MTKNLSANGVYAGVPARKICTTEEYEKKYSELKEGCPDFSAIHPWYEWKNSTLDERKNMLQKIENKIGFI